MCPATDLVVADALARVRVRAHRQLRHRVHDLVDALGDRRVVRDEPARENRHEAYVASNSTTSIYSVAISLYKFVLIFIEAEFRATKCLLER